MNLTQEQQDIVDYCETLEGKDLVMINSVAGSGKTTLLKAIADTLNTKPGLYLAYNKALATSAAKKFPKNIDCRTTHSLAYKSTVVPLRLNVGFFGYKQIKEGISYNEKYLLIEDIREFCLSRFLTYEEYAKEYGRINQVLANSYLTKMSEGIIDCTHDFYLKMFHIYLANGDIEIPTWDLLMLDEAGDLNEVTLEIFKLLPARIKVAVGDPYQNIYTFNHTINCFEKLEGQGTTFKLSKSFRVPVHIAEQVEKFCKDYLDPDMAFEGTEAVSTDITSRGYISRTNGGLINKLIELNEDNVPYGLVRSAQDIFKIPLMVAGLKDQGKIYDPAYRHVQEDVDEWTENVSGVKTQYPSLTGYLKHKHSEDLTLMQALNLVGKHSKKTIFDAYAEAKHHENKKQNLTLLTAHSSKGLEFDEVILAPDMNSSIEETVLDMKLDEDKVLTVPEKESLNLYYVAVTRALVSIRNALFLTGD
jgi:F-box protein 18 (helicase)